MKNRVCSDNRGSALLVVICITGLFLVLSLSILVSASTLTNAANREINQQQAQIAAVSFSNVFMSELEKVYYVQGPGELVILNDSEGIQTYVCENIWKYVAYVEGFNNTQFISPYSYWFFYNEEDEDDRHADKSTNIIEINSDGNSGLGSYTVELYWTAVNGDIGLNTGFTDEVGYDKREQNGQITLNVKLTANYRNEEYSVTSIYALKRTRTYLNGEIQNEAWQWLLSERY